MNLNDYDPPKCYTTTNPKARKDHVCCECEGRIRKGERYIYTSGIGDEPFTYKTCADCDNLRIAECVTAPYTGLDECLCEAENFYAMAKMTQNRLSRGVKPHEWAMKNYEKQKHLL